MNDECVRQTNACDDHLQGGVCNANAHSHAPPRGQNKEATTPRITPCQFHKRRWPQLSDPKAAGGSQNTRATNQERTEVRRPPKAKMSASPRSHLRQRREPSEGKTCKNGATKRRNKDVQPIVESLSAKRGCDAEQPGEQLEDSHNDSSRVMRGRRPSMLCPSNSASNAA